MYLPCELSVSKCGRRIDFKRLGKVEFVGEQFDPLCYLEWPIVSFGEFPAAK